MITYPVSTQIIADTICTAVEGASNYWLDSFTIVPSTPLWYAEPAFYEQPFEIRVAWDGEFNIITHAHFREGFRLMAEHVPYHYADLVNDNVDAITADVLLQYIVLGDIVYG